MLVILLKHLPCLRSNRTLCLFCSCTANTNP